MSSLDKFIFFVSVLISLVFPRAFAEEKPLPKMDCVIEPYIVSNVSSSADGIIYRIYVKEGQKVKKNQKLARLASGVEKVSVRLARAKSKLNQDVKTKKLNVKFLKEKHKRVVELFNEKVVSSHDKEESEMKVKLAEIEFQRAEALHDIKVMELKRAKAALERRTVRSPVHGVIVDRYLSLGESVKDKPLFKVVQLNPLRVEVIAKSKYFGRVHEGTKAKVFTELNPEKTLDAIVSTVSPVIDAASATFDFTLSLPNPKLKIPGGLRCKVQLFE